MTYRLFDIWHECNFTGKFDNFKACFKSITNDLFKFDRNELIKCKFMLEKLYDLDDDFIINRKQIGQIMEDIECLIVNWNEIKDAKETHK